MIAASQNTHNGTLIRVYTAEQEDSRDSPVSLQRRDRQDSLQS